MSDSKDNDKSIVWTGRLTRGELPGTVVGYLEDVWHWRIHITGTLDKESGGYTLLGRTGEIPDSLRVQAIDDPIAEDG